MMKDEIREHLVNKVVSFASYVKKLHTTIKALGEQIKICKHIWTFTRKAEVDRVRRMFSSVPLNEAIVSVFNDLISSRQWQKLLSKVNLGAAVAKASVFDPEFIGGAAIESIIKRSKKWLKNNAFSSGKILKQMDTGEGTLSYDIISVLSACKKGNKQVCGRLLCRPACLQ